MMRGFRKFATVHATILAKLVVLWYILHYYGRMAAQIAEVHAKAAEYGIMSAITMPVVDWFGVTTAVLAVAGGPAFYMWMNERSKKHYVEEIKAKNGHKE